MFNRFFGKKSTPSIQKESDIVTETVSEERRTQTEEKATEAMAKIRGTITELNTKVTNLQKQIDADSAIAITLRNEGKDAKDPKMKSVLTRLKKEKEDISKYQTMILSQEKTLSSVDDAVFVQEMASIMAATNDALSACAADANKMERLLDQIEDHKDRIREVMSLLMQSAEEDNGDLDDMLGELDADIRREKDKKDREEAEMKKNPLPIVPQGTPIPVPTYSTPVPVPVPRMLDNPEDDLEAMLNGLSIVCFNQTENRGIRVCETHVHCMHSINHIT